MRRHSFMLKKERVALGKKLATLLKVDRTALLDICQQAMVQTKGGLLRVHFDEKDYGCILCRFEDPDAARKTLHGDERIFIGGGQRLNPHSGKWNFHFGACTADEAFQSFLYEFNKVAL